MNRDWENEFETLLEEQGQRLVAFFKGVEDKAKGTPLTPEQVEGLRKTGLIKFITKDGQEARSTKDWEGKGFNQAISHINANYWLIPKDKK